ncbi:hypothetical protein IV203_015670 [Nitzschia inconspicua]|uniref:TATA element modulatory factor 1 TATA binding domain-containing protein n=1 Tax=Nitzschia inconspicua TaxID=303405 RepID=A0A9K3PTP6_9STRA|nr:hypothetical protein IV203_015670 [Nitzschia inconspicua]
MWNNWVEKAKIMAADIDQQLNEAVGAEADRSNNKNNKVSTLNNNTSSTTTNTSLPLSLSSSASAFGGLLLPSVTAAAVATTSTTSTQAVSDTSVIPDEQHVTGGGNDDDDVWNDDFDFGDEENDNNNEDKQKVAAEPITEIKMEADIVAEPEPATGSSTTKSIISTNEQAEIPAKQVSVNQTDILESEPKNDVVTAELSDTDPWNEKEDPTKIDASQASQQKEAEAMVGDDLKIDVAQAESQTDKPVDIASSTAAPVAEEKSKQDTQDTEQFSSQQETTTNDPSSSSLQETPAEAGWDDFDPIDVSTNREDDDDESPPPIVETMAPTGSNTPPHPETVPESHSQETEVLSSKASQTAVPSFTGIATSETNKESNSNSSSGGLFSSLAHRAEGGVSSLLTAAAHLAKDDDIDNDDVVNNDLTEKQKDSSTSANTKKDQGPSNTLSGFFSAAVNTVLTEAPKNLVKTLEPDNQEAEDDEWEEHDDLDITEHDGIEGPVKMIQEASLQSDNQAMDEPEKLAPPNTMPGEHSTDLVDSVADMQMGDVGKQSGESTSVDSSNEAASSFVQVSPVSISPLHETSTAVEEEEKPVTRNVSEKATISNIEDDPRYKQLQQALQQREDQLSNKSVQLTQLQALMETQEQDYKKKLQETKEEAKKRIIRAKERCEAAEAKLRLQSSSGSEDAAKQEQLIAALRSEGEALAMKQAAMEQAVRAAKTETRELREQLEDEVAMKENALEKIKSLEAELKATRDSLAAARKGESQASKLENDLLAARSDAEQKSNTILSLQQHIKELTAESKDLKNEIAKIQKAAAHEAQQEKTNMRREHNDLLSDLEAKLRTTEREAGVREDALRHEVAELRKRWQDAVRRADALSMDIQSSTAPLLRQLESMERQNRARASNWAELEGRLRSELEECVIQNESLSKDRADFKAKFTRYERLAKERDEELAAARKTIEEQTIKITTLESQLAKLTEEAEKRQEEYEKVERLASEGVAKVRSEMSQTVVESEERYRGQIDKLEKELKMEREKRTQLESQVDQLLENAGMIVAGPQAPENFRRESKPKKLRQAEGQAEILAGALGLDSSDDESVDEFDDFDDDEPVDADGPTKKGGVNSYAALEQLTSKLKTAQVELSSLRQSLRESELTRESLVQELGETRHAKEKLPLFEAKVRELTEENREKELEIMGLRDDISEVKEMYRAQLNLLVEEKIANEQHQLSTTGINIKSLVEDSDIEPTENPADG